MQELTSNRAPGLDGIPIEFYKTFWGDIKDIFLDSIIFAHETGQLCESQYQGVITLIPKPEKELLQVTNYRPITLLNCDYKIVAKVLNNRLNLEDSCCQCSLSYRLLVHHLRLSTIVCNSFRISFGFFKVFLVVCSSLMTFLCCCLFSKFKKYLVFFSPNSVHLARLLIIAPSVFFAQLYHILFSNQSIVKLLCLNNDL